MARSGEGEPKSVPRSESFRAFEYLLFACATVLVFLLCVCVGSVNIPMRDTVGAIMSALFGTEAPEGISVPVIMSVRLPRVICTALVGAALSLCGASVQGLLRNPLADSSTLGVSSGAALGAVLAIAFDLRIPGLDGGGIAAFAMVFAFLTLVFIMSLAYKLDYSLSTNTIILVGVVFSMFASSMINLATTFSGERVRTITFWMMGSLAGTSYGDVAFLSISLFLCGGVLLRYAQELNAFAIGEDNARHVGIDVKRVKLFVLIAVAALVGICVSIGGSIGFVGLIIPHMTRMITGPNHRRLLPASLFSGAIFLMLADLVARILLRPLELHIGVVTSIIGSVLFVYIFYSTRKVR